MEEYLEQIVCELEQTKRVNPYSISELQVLLNEQELDFAEIERICFSVVSNLFDDRPLIELQDNDSKILWYDYLKLQIYVFLKGQGNLGEDHSLLAAGSALVVENIASDIFSKFGVNDKLIPLVVSLVLCVAVKVSSSAWCSYFYDEQVRGSERLKNALKEMMRENDTGEV